MKGNKFMAAVLAASMASSIVPITAINVFAAKIADDSITVENAYDDSTGTTATATAIDTALETKLDDTYWANGDYTTGNSASTVKTAIDNVLDGGSGTADYEADASTIAFTSAKTFTFNVYNGGANADPKEIYKVTVDGETKKFDKTILDDYFKAHTFSIAKDSTFTSSMVAAQLTKQNTVALATNDPDDELDDKANTDNYTFSGSTKAVTVTDGKATGDITVTVNGGASYTYTYTANVTITDTTEDDAKKAAIEKINATTYPMYNTADAIGTSHAEAALEKKIASDLTDAGYPGSTQLSNPRYKAPTKTADGYLKATVGTYDAINVKLKYNSDSKSADTQKVVKKVLGVAAGTVGGSGINVTQHKTSTNNITLATSEFINLVAATPKATINKTDKLSMAVQAKTATKEATQDEVVAAVKKAIDDQLTAAGIKDNGVSVSVDAVNTYTGTSLAAGTVASGHTATATTSDSGEWTLLVTTSIDNDFEGYKDSSNAEDTSSKTEVRYLVDLKTNKLSSNKATAISLADKTAYLGKGYAGSANEGYQYAPYTYVEMKAALTPEESNTAVTYKITDSDGNVISNKVASGSILAVEADDPTDTAKTTIYAAHSTTKVKASDGALGIIVTKAGKYTVTATAGDLSATATLTVKDNYDDVPATAYYNNAVAWADSQNVTNGVTPDTFGVINDVTRAQYVTWLYRYAVSRNANVAIADDAVKSVFSDVATTAYYAKAVQWAKEAGVVDGKTSTTFAPDTKITRAEAITMLWRAYGKPSAGEGREDEATVKFTDVPANAYYTTAVTWAVNSSTQVTQGTSTTTFSPNKTCSRAEGITFIYRVYGY